MTKKALPGIDLGSVLMYITCVILIIIAIILCVMKVSQSLSVNSEESLYVRPTWTELEDD